jgi:hypothetical protein
MRGLPPIPPVGMTIGPVGKERVGEASAVKLGAETEIWEMDPELEAVTEADIDGVPVEALAWLEARPVEEEAKIALLDCVRLLVGAAGVSKVRFFFPNVPAFLTDNPL